MPLRAPFRSATGVEHRRDILLVRAHTDVGDGWGECVAQTSPHYAPEYVDGAQDVITRFLAPVLLAATELDAAGVAPALAGFVGHAMAKAALEMAVLDAELRATGQRLADRLGATRARVPAGVAVGLAGSVGELLDEVAGYLDQGYQRVKLKIAPGHDIEPVAAARERFGPELVLTVDANGSYTAGDAEHLAWLDPFELTLIEQPLPPDALCAHAVLARRLRTPVGLDESITSPAVAADAITLGAGAAVGIKAGRVGGYLAARRVHDMCLAGGAAAWCGGMLETGLGRAANLALAALPGMTLAGDLSASERYWAEDLTPPFVLDDGHLAVPTGPGLGVEPRPDLLAALTTSVTTIGA